MAHAPLQDRLAPPSARGAVVLGAVLLLLTGLVSGLWSTARAAESDTDYDSWGAVVEAITTELDAAAESYGSGDTAGAAAAFQRAYNSGYVASNLQVVTTDNLGAETASEQRQAFTDLRQAAYAAGNAETISAGVTELSDSLADTAAQLDELDSLADPRTYAADQAPPSPPSGPNSRPTRPGSTRAVVSAPGPRSPPR
ncbi:hypothetical protein [Actinomyces ruminis]|uniref:hypothetical protein n=1 Tax=Actinomyces ruminis TaxID=1937003 RepID=UPI000B72419F|nr:hypothetical protein [Actinomyces ruminis]